MYCAIHCTIHCAIHGRHRVHVVAMDGTILHVRIQGIGRRDEQPHNAEDRHEQSLWHGGPRRRWSPYRCHVAVRIFCIDAFRKALRACLPRPRELNHRNAAVARGVTDAQHSLHIVIRELRGARLTQDLAELLGVERAATISVSFVEVSNEAFLVNRCEKLVHASEDRAGYPHVLHVANEKARQTRQTSLLP